MYNLMLLRILFFFFPGIHSINLFYSYLSFNAFKGEIPKELAILPELRYLYLHENRFSGRIPAELGTLKNLRHLYESILFSARLCHILTVRTIVSAI